MYPREARDARHDWSYTPTNWLDEFAPAVSAAAMSVVCFVGLIVLSNLHWIEPRLRNAAIFFASISIMPALADEQNTPVSASHAAQLCAKNTGMARIIIKSGR